MRRNNRNRTGTLLVSILLSAFILTAVFYHRLTTDQSLETQSDKITPSVNTIQGSESATIASIYEKWYDQDHKRRANALKSAGKTYVLHYTTQDQVHCKNKIRFGSVLDGGKYVCSPHVLYNNKNCLIYSQTFSLGVAGDTSFESDLIQFTNDSCKIYGFDMGERSREPFMKLPSKKVQFDAVKIGTGNYSKNNASIPSLLQYNGHTRLDILKIDLELAEYEAMPPLLEKIYNREITICQILIEIHHGELGDINSPRLNHYGMSACLPDITRAFKAKGQPLKLLQQFERAGYLQFAQEANVMFSLGHGCAEYAYVHRDCFEELGLSEADLYNSIRYMRDFESEL